jgi:hypothetical protein
VLLTIPLITAVGIAQAITAAVAGYVVDRMIRIYLLITWTDLVLLVILVAIAAQTLTGDPTI